MGEGEREAKGREGREGDCKGNWGTILPHNTERRMRNHSREGGPAFALVFFRLGFDRYRLFSLFLYLVVARQCDPGGLLHITLNPYLLFSLHEGADLQ